MRDVLVELKQLRLHGMAGAWGDLVDQGPSAGLDSARWLIEQLLQAEHTDRAMRSVRHQMLTAKFPIHRDLAGFDFEVSPVDRKLVTTLATMAFTDDAHNAVLVGAPVFRPDKPHRELMGIFPNVQTHWSHQCLEAGDSLHGHPKIGAAKCREDWRRERFTAYRPA